MVAKDCDVIGITLNLRSQRLFNLNLLQNTSEKE